jgi:REP element-mobilizing transposase RayT
MDSVYQKQGDADAKTGQGDCAQFPPDIVQRGHNRQPVFVQRRDFEYYLANLQEWKQVYELDVFSYCLMTNHVHLVVQANDNLSAIPQLVKRLAGRQTRFVNTLEKRNGSLSDELIRAAINSNKLTGGNKFVDEIENRIGTRVETRKPGRATTEK